ncbi:MAG TPA: glycoside hydrolase family 172 protein [Aggregatilineales bacterium]|nr:glycoside hydrolase family 172 protein [Aggregatilineales bacterium]
MFPIHQSLSSLPYQTGVITRQISAENPTGEKGKGCLWDPNPDDPNLPHSRAAVDLGRGWKVHPFISLAAGHTALLADIDGPGCINQMWITSDLPEYRALVLRFTWDNEDSPSVEVPLGDFFAMGHDSSPHQVMSLPVVVGPYRACSAYWQMPFRRHARITLENEGPTDARIIAYKFLYKLHDIPDDTAYFHAQWRRSMTRRDYPEHVIVDGLRGRGLYVGTYLAWSAFSRGWWGEGEVKFYIDGDTEFPTIADNGTEDYFGGAWCFNPDGLNGPEQTFSSPYSGLPLAETSSGKGPRKFSLYRWHLFDSIGFSEDLRVTVQALGWWPDRKYEPLTDDIASVAYWYQREPHASFPKLPDIRARWGR